MTGYLGYSFYPLGHFYDFEKQLVYLDKRLKIYNWCSIFYLLGF